MGTISHTKVSEIADGVDDTLVRPSDWNDLHDFSLAPGDITGLTTVATDVIFDAAGDIVQGTGANASARLPLGTEGQFLRAGASSLAYADTFIIVPLISKAGVVTVTTEGDSPAPFRFYNDSGRTLTFAAARATATIGPSGATMTLDLNVDGTTVFGAGAKIVLPDTTGAPSTVKQTSFATATIADGHYLSGNVDTPGGAAVENLSLVVWLKG